MNRYKDLKVWQKAVELITKIYKVTDSFPSKEQFGIISQINRSAVSIAANIAEGAGRNTKKDFNHFLSISLGSACELETLLIVSFQLNFIKQNELDLLNSEIDQIQKMLFALQNANKKVQTIMA
jgi:four helix bundle protein